MHGSNRVDRHEAYIVAIERVLRPRIAEADKELHRIIPDKAAGPGIARKDIAREVKRLLLLFFLLLLFLEFLLVLGARRSSLGGSGTLRAFDAGLDSLGGDGSTGSGLFSRTSDDGRHGEVALGD